MIPMSRLLPTTKFSANRVCLMYLRYTLSLNRCSMYLKVVLTVSDHPKVIREMANLLPPPEEPDLKDNNVPIGLCWEKWKRSLNFYLGATKITGAEQKRDTLLLLGGSKLQEIMFNLPGAYVVATEGVDVFKVAVEKLDDYFLPKRNRVYERHIFHQIKQVKGEKFNNFVARLQNQAENCNFTCPEESLIDQIVEKCLSAELQNKIFILGDNVTLDRIITEANILEAEEGQQEVNRIKKKTSNSKPVVKPRCKRCGRVKHSLTKTECPAKKKPCIACGILGHFSKSLLCRLNIQQKRTLEKQKVEQNIKGQRKKDRLVNNILLTS